MNFLNLLLGIILLVFIFGMLYQLAVRRAKDLVEMELESSAPNAFADVMLDPVPTPKSSSPDNVFTTRHSTTPSKDHAANTKLGINPVILYD